MKKAAGLFVKSVLVVSLLLIGFMLFLSWPVKAQPGDPCQTLAKQYTPITITSGTTTRLVAPVAGKQTYICHLSLSAAAGDNVGIVEGTGGTCGTGTAGVIGGATAANGVNLAANGTFIVGNGASAVAATAGVNVDFCLITSSAGPLAGFLVWVQR